MDRLARNRWSRASSSFDTSQGRLDALVRPNRTCQQGPRSAHLCRETTAFHRRSVNTVRRVSQKAVRFAVVDQATGKHGGAWKIWAQKNDVYITPIDLGSRVKVSLHEGVWRLAYTSEHWATGEAPNNAPGPGRSIWEIEHLPDVIDGLQCAWFIAVPPETLLRTESLNPRIEQITFPSSPDFLVVINIWICAPDREGAPANSIPPSPLALADGRLVWVGCDLHPYRAPNQPPPRPIVGTAIGFSRPDRVGGTPGFNIQTVDVDWGSETPVQIDGDA
jgi:hypothetical protein